jgi:hypothetical protein
MIDNPRKFGLFRLLSLLTHHALANTNTYQTAYFDSAVVAGMPRHFLLDMRVEMIAVMGLK